MVPDKLAQLCRIMSDIIRRAIIFGDCAFLQLSCKPGSMVHYLSRAFISSARNQKCNKTIDTSCFKLCGIHYKDTDLGSANLLSPFCIHFLLAKDTTFMDTRNQAASNFWFCFLLATVMWNHFFFFFATDLQHWNDTLISGSDEMWHPLMLWLLSSRSCLEISQNYICYLDYWH